MAWAISKANRGMINCIKPVFFPLTHCFAGHMNIATVRGFHGKDCAASCGKSCCESVEVTARRHSSLFASFVALTGAQRLLKVIVFGQLLGGKLLSGDRDKKFCFKMIAFLLNSWEVLLSAAFWTSMCERSDSIIPPQGVRHPSRGEG